jgi:hypothetical protein
VLLIIYKGKHIKIFYNKLALIMAYNIEIFLKKKNEPVLISQLNPVGVFRESTLTVARGL